jgi:predicted DNA-binding protein
MPRKAMKGVTIKLPKETLRDLRDEAQATGRTVASLVRKRVEAYPLREGGSFYALTADLAGSLAGRRRSATNARRRFRPS